jgi:chromosome segregation ATPase
LREAERKLVVVKRDLEKTRDKADAMEKRVEVLQETIETANNNLRELEEKESNSQEKESLNEEKMTFLQGQLKEAEVRREAAERSCNVLRRNIDDIQVEINTWTKKISDIEEEFANMNDVSDSDEEEE